jgi:hypothetical protein
VYNEVQDGIESYYDEVGGIVNRDRFLKGHCIPFIATNISGRSSYFLLHKLINPADIKPKNAGKKQYMREDDYNEEEERMMLEFNNNLTQNRIEYDPSILQLVRQEGIEEEVKEEEDTIFLSGGLTFI